jgi:glucose-6-phosphate 1-dehydrogenase
MSENNVLVIFGSTGDLTYQKLLPALADLLKRKPNLLKKILLIGRQGNTLEAYLQYGLDRGLDLSSIQSIVPLLQYVYLQATESKEYTQLKPLLKPYDSRFFYLATPPTMFHLITENLHQHGLIEKTNHHHRCAYEKPFGENSSTAQVLNQLLHESLDEKQIYRVDHYLAKPLIQQLIKLRMQWATVGMEEYWQSSNIKLIEILAYESVGILSRGKFYDATGALKDMIQSHLLETLALLMMELPKRIDDVDAIQVSKIHFLKSLNPVMHEIVFGQYDGYLQEPNVNPSSVTETYVSLPLRSQLTRWKDTSIRIQTGKKLEEKRTQIIIHWRTGGTLIFNISPSVNVEFTSTWFSTLPIILQKHLSALSHHPFAKHDAYANVFSDFILGNQTLFPSNNEILATWSLIDHVKQTPILPKRYLKNKDLMKG